MPRVGLTDKGRIKDQFIESLARGQTPAANLVDVVYPVELIYNDIKYKFDVSQNGTDSFVLECNDSWVLVAVRGLSDGGMLVMMGGKSFNVYLKSETGGLRMVVDGQTYVLQRYDHKNCCKHGRKIGSLYG